MTDRIPAWLLAVGAIVTVQLGAALATSQFASIGPAGTAWMRLTFGALIFLVIARPNLSEYSKRDLQFAVVLGVVSGLMTVAFLCALQRLPLGTTVAIEFLGPLGVAVARSHNRRALIWPIMAFLGVIAITQPWTGHVDALGVLFACLAGSGWGAYILLTQRVGDVFSGFKGLAITIPIAAVVSSFIGIPQAWGHITWQVLVISLFLALMMPVIPFALELMALRRLTAASFGTLMALEPAFGTLWGIVLLNQIPDALQVAGVALVVCAGIGAERSGHRTDEGPEPIAPQIT
jgi:inner membrane transporter RhtA